MYRFGERGISSIMDRDLGKTIPWYQNYTFTPKRRHFRRKNREMAVMRTTLERCPEEKFGGKPHPKSFAIPVPATYGPSADEQG
jgi:hypothetical protein